MKAGAYPWGLSMQGGFAGCCLVATLVLLVVVIAGFIWLPLPRWKANAIELAAAAFYVENWVLAHRSIDYLAQDLEPSAVGPVLDFV